MFNMEFLCLKNVHIKEEPTEQVEDIRIMEEVEDTDTGMTMDVDPMNLLEPVAECTRHDEEEHQDASDYNSDYLITKCDDGTLVDKWQLWLKTFPWLLRSEESKDHGFCLYCGKQVAVNGVTALQRHDAALIHKERQQNYEAFESAFQDSNENTNIVRIKNESMSEKEINAAELISNRLSQSKELNDFNWNNWLKTHSWLVRQREEGTKGYCKYCKMEFDVEFSLTRERHEKALKHKVGEKLYWRHINKEDCNKEDTLSDCSSGKNIKDCEGDSNSNEFTNRNNISARGRHFEKLPQSSTHCRCRLCCVVLDKHSWYKHMKTKNHRRNLQQYKKLKSGKKNTVKNKTIDWAKYAQLHPWISPDPENSKYAYCLYCNKRLMYGLSSVKRYLHENSFHHREAMKQKIANDSQICESKRNEKMSQAVKQQNNTGSESQESEGENIDGIKEKSFKRAGICTDEWFKIHRYYQKNPENSDYIYCKCCKVLLLIRNFSLKKHEKSERHQIFAKQWKDDINEGEVIYADLHIRKRARTYVSWLGYTKSGQNYCKFCRIVLSRKYWPTSHERTERHKLAAQKFFNKKNILKIETSRTELKPQEDKGATEKYTDSKESKWQIKFPWLLHNNLETREHYAFCSYCKQSVYVPTTKFASKHQCTANHIRASLILKQNSQSKNDEEESKEAYNDVNSAEVNSNILKNETFPWLLPDPQNDKNYGYCNYCKIRIMIKGILATTHHNSKNHKLAAQTYLRQQEREKGQNNNTINVGQTVNLKSDESLNNDLVEYNEQLSISSTPEHKSSISLATRLTNAHTEILGLCRELNGNKRRKNSILSTAPFSIAACLSPFDPDNIGCCRTLEKSRDQSESTLPGRERDTYDLFFESMKETVKKLPTDLAAESRIKIMQVVYDLEIRALERNPSSQNTATLQRPESQSSDVHSIVNDTSAFIPVNGLHSPKHSALNGDM